MAPNHSSMPFDFPHWQREYEALISETDDKRLAERATALENALFLRLQSPAQHAYPTAEDVAIKVAFRKLHNIQEQRLGFHKWGKS
jgi:hypothetical protein